MLSNRKNILLPLLLASLLAGGCATIPVEGGPAPFESVEAPTHDTDLNDAHSSDPIAVTESEHQVISSGTKVVASTEKSDEAVFVLDTEHDPVESVTVGGAASNLSEHVGDGTRLDLSSTDEHEALIATEFASVGRTAKLDVEINFSDSVKYLVMVRPGDYLTEIAYREYSNPSAWRNIYSWNRETIGDNPNMIHPYRELALFKPQNEISEEGYDFIIHSVSRGESLWSIAKDWYGDNLAWVALYTDNEEALARNGGRLLSGMEVRIRTNLIQADTEAIRLSSTRIE